jgi:glycosyltransferase involved in cell wall biosynthesis
MAGAEHGGAETAYVDMCIALKEAGEDIVAVTRPNSPARIARLKAAGIVVHELPFGGMLDFATTRRMKGIIRDFGPQVVQTWMSRAAQKTPNRRSNKGAAPYVTVARLGNYYAMKYFRTADYFTTITPMIREYLIKKGVAPDDVRHINNFAETEDGAQPVPRNMPDDATLLLGLGRLHEAKAFDTLMRAIADQPDIHLWIAGEGPDRESLEALRDELKLKDRVTFLGWRDDRAALLRTADICVFSSRFEPFGTVFVQAWAEGTPLVTTDADGPRQFVRDDQDGLVVPVDDVAALGAAIRRMADNPSLRARLAAAGRERYRAEFTKAGTVAAYLAFYREILARAGI